MIHVAQWSFPTRGSKGHGCWKPRIWQGPWGIWWACQEATLLIWHFKADFVCGTPEAFLVSELMYLSFKNFLAILAWRLLKTLFSLHFYFIFLIGLIKRLKSWNRLKAVRAAVCCATSRNGVLKCTVSWDTPALLPASCFGSPSWWG